MPCDVKWNEHGWICTTQMNSFRFPEEMTHCWFSNCSGRSERTVQIKTIPKQSQIIPKAPTVASKNICSYVKCNKLQAVNRKYCSDKCRKRQARWAYNQRKLNSSLTIGKQVL